MKEEPDEEKKGRSRGWGAPCFPRTPAGRQMAFYREDRPCEGRSVIDRPLFCGFGHRVDRYIFAAELTGVEYHAAFPEREQRVVLAHADVTAGIDAGAALANDRSEAHTSELQSLMRNSYAGFCLKKKTIDNKTRHLS